MATLVLFQPPPQRYALIVSLRTGGDHRFLMRARIIIHSYLIPFDKVTMRRIKKGVHYYVLNTIDPVIDRSIVWTLENETWPHLNIQREELPCQNPL